MTIAQFCYIQRKRVEKHQFPLVIGIAVIDDGAASVEVIMFTR